MIWKHQKYINFKKKNLKYNVKQALETCYNSYFHKFNN